MKNTFQLNYDWYYMVSYTDQRKNSVRSTLISILKCRNILNNYTVSVHKTTLLQICML
jgi:hypothetical protein